MQTNKDKQYYDIHIGRYDLFFKKSYTILYNINDFLISLLFFLGSIMFFWKEWKELGIWLFVIGSALFSVRPLIRVIHSFHWKRYVKKNINN